MTHEIERFNVGNVTVVITHDPDPLNPRKEFDNAGTMVCFHRRYALGDTHDFGTPDDFRTWRAENEGDIVAIMPLFLYDHSGLTMRTTRFDCPWDSGQVGWIYLTRQRQEEWGIADPSATLTVEVDTYDEYLQGSVYCFSIVQDGQDVDGSCGYIGLDHCRTEARHTAEGYALQP
jgi:hypothetical protein